MGKTYIVTFETFVNALKHEWKGLLAILLLFSLLGVGAGSFYAKRLTAPPEGEAEELPQLSFDELPNDKNYYTTCYAALNQQNENIKAYLNVLKTEKEKKNNGLQDEQDKILSELTLATREFSDLTLLRINQFRSQPNHLFVPQEFCADLLLEYRNKLAMTEQDILISAQAVELLENMRSPNELSREDVAAPYAQILNSAAKHASNLNDKAKYETYIDLLENHEAQIVSDTKKLVDMEKDALKKINDLTFRLHAVAQTICEENYIDIAVETSENNVATVTVTHTHKEALPQDNFAIILIFCALVGICVGFFYAVCREAKREAAMCAETVVCKPIETATGIEQDSKK